MNPDDPSTFKFGHFVETLATGETIRGTFGGRILPTPTSDIDGVFLIDAAQKINGGTGRFRDASGGAIVSGLLNQATGEARLVIEGHLRIPRR